jgi:hypothetical protein
MRVKLLLIQLYFLLFVLNASALFNILRNWLYQPLCAIFYYHKCLIMFCRFWHIMIKVLSLNDCVWEKLFLNFKMLPSQWIPDHQPAPRMMVKPLSCEASEKQHYLHSIKKWEYERIWPSRKIQSFCTKGIYFMPGILYWVALCIQIKQN